MADKVWLTDFEVGSRFGSTRQWVWVQARTNPKFHSPLNSLPAFRAGLFRKLKRLSMWR